MKEVFAIIQRNGDKKGKPFWQKIGVAFPNSDGSLNVVLNCIPLDGRLHIRDPKPTDTSATTPAK